MPKPQKTALVYAVDLLSRQEQSEQRLREKLQRKGYEAEEIEAALERLRSKHYLDDEAACKRQFAYFYQESRSSVRQICLKLQQRGFASSLVRQCVPDDTYEREYQAALKNLNIKYRPSADQQKMLASLYRAGFGTSVCRAAVEQFTSEAEEE